MPYLKEGTQLMENNGGMLNELGVVNFDVYIYKAYDKVLRREVEVYERTLCS